MRYLIFLLISISSLSAIGQDEQRRYKFRSTTYMAIFFEENGRVDIGTGWKDSITVIVIDRKEAKMNFYGADNSSYDLVSKPEKYSVDNHDVLRWFPCIDEKGSKCAIRLKTLGKTSLNKAVWLLYIDYKDVTYVYRVTYDGE